MSGYLELARKAAREKGLSAVDERNDVNELSPAQNPACATQQGLNSFISERPVGDGEWESSTESASLYDLLVAARLAGIRLHAEDGKLIITGSDDEPELRDRLVARSAEIVSGLRRFSTWIARHDANGVLGWEAPNLSDESRWWSRSNAWPLQT